MEKQMYPNPRWSTVPSVKLPIPNETRKTIEVTHINVRESISFLIIKLIGIDILVASFILFFYIPMMWLTNAYGLLGQLFSLHTLIFFLLMMMKIFITILIIFQWLNEYYEITPTRLIHKKGLIFKKEEEFVFVHLMSIDYQQTLLGRILNYGNIHLYDRYINRDIYLSLIHNPKRYFIILKELVPFTDTYEQEPREHFFEDEDEESLVDTHNSHV